MSQRQELRTNATIRHNEFEHGRLFHDFNPARQYQTVNGKRSDVPLEEQETIDAWIDLSCLSYDT
jgi:hypothetical protein